MTVDGSGSPIRKARVSLINEGGASPADVYADSDGRFEFTNLAAGRYTASAWKTGYVERKYGAHSLWDRHVSIVLPAASVMAGIDIALPRSAAISGRIVNAFGGPMAGVVVTALRVMVSKGHPGVIDPNVARSSPAQEGVTTDDLGEYRIGGLEAATYVVSAWGWPATSTALGEAQRAAAAALRRPFASEADRMDAVMRARPVGGPHQIFYPGSASIGLAQPLTLRAGEESAGVDVALSYDSIRTAIISGRIVDPTGTAGRTSVAITSDGGGVLNAAGGIVSGARPDGTFSLPADPGEHTVYAEGDGSVAMQHVSVTGEDVTDLQLVLRKPARVSGRVVIDGAVKPDGTRIAIEAWSPESLGMRRAVAVVTNGAFSFADLIGARVFRLASAPGLTLTAVTLAGRNVLDLPVEFKGGEHITDAVIVLSATPAQLSGTVAGPDHRPVTDVSVVLFAEDRQQLPSRAYWVRPDTTGRFAVGGLAPGEYLIALVADVDDTQWSAPAYLDSLRGGATKVSLANDEKKTIALTWSGGR